MNKLEKFYIYAYIRENSGIPYYIGKGKDDRAWRKHKSVKRPTDINRIIIMENNLTEIGAFALERRYIRWFGRIDLGTGVLRNLTDGGEGASNPNMSSRLLMKESKQGIRNPRYGISPPNKNCPMPIERKKKLSAHYQKEYIVIFPDGHNEIIESTLTKLSKDFSLDLGATSKVVSGKRKSHKGYIIKEKT